MKKLIAFLTLALLISGSLSAQTKQTTKKKKKAKQELIAKEGKYRLVVSFISKGAGLDRKAHDSILKYIEKHPKKPVFETQHWGREGEVDYYLNLKELRPKEQAIFVEDIKKLISDKEMVFVQENAEYVKKGR